MMDDLIEDDIKVAQDDGHRHLYNLFFNGVTGYLHMSDDEIKQLHKEYGEQQAISQ